MGVLYRSERTVRGTYALEVEKTRTPDGPAVVISDGWDSVTIDGEEWNALLDAIDCHQVGRV